MNPNRAPLVTKALLGLAAVLIVPTTTTLAQSLWIGGTSDYNVAGSWNPTGVPTGNASNDSGSNNVVLIQPGDPVWQHGDTLAGNSAVTSGSYLQTGSTNNTGGGNWLRLGLATGSFGSYVLSNGVVNVGGQTHLGEYGVGYLEIDGGTYNTGGANPGLAAGDANDFGNGSVGTLVVTGGTFNNPQETWIGTGNGGRIGTGHFVMHGGIINVNNWFVFGRFGGQADGYMDGGTINKNSNGNMQLAVGNQGSTGAHVTFTQVGGTINCQSEYQVATDNALAVCTNNIGGTAVLTVNNWFGVGRASGNGTLNLSGNAAVTKTGINGGNITIGAGGGSAAQNAQSQGVINQTGGTFTNTATQTWVGETGTGVWNMNGGNTVLGVVRLSDTSGASGTFNLNGGDLTAREITSSGGAGYFYFNGGTLHAGSGSTVLMHDVSVGAYLSSGGAVIDSAGANVSIAQGLMDNGGGSLTKVGNGALSLTGANGYSGSTFVNVGKLATTTASFGSGAYSVADAAELGVTVVGFHDSQLPVSNLSLGASTAAALDIDLGSFGNPDPGYAPINVTGTLAVNGAITVNIADSLPAIGEFPLIQYGSRTGSGTLVLGTLPIGVQAYLTTNTSVIPNSIDLVVTSAGSPRWDGQVSGVPTSIWDINTTADWIEQSTLAPTTYREGNPVLFDDNALGTNVVGLVANVHPGAITVNNSIINYTLAGTNKISGATGLTKQGTASLAIVNTGGNDYTGPTVIAGGTLSVTNLANGGSPSALGASSASASNLVISNATLSYSGPPVAVNRGFSVQGTNSTIDAESNLTFGGQTASGLGGATVKTGLAQLAYTAVGTNILSLSPPVRPGYDVAAGTVLLDGSAGPQTNYTGSELWVSGIGTPASLVLSNTTLYSASWLGLGRGNGSVGLSDSLTLYNSTYTAGGGVSLGYDNGLAGYQANPVLTLNGSSVLTNRGDSNLGESPGANITLNLNDSSTFGSINRIFIGMATNSTASLGATGTVSVASSAKLFTSAWLSIGNSGGVGSLTVKNNGSVSAGDFNVTDSNAGLGTFTMQDNAQINVANFYVGKGGGSVGVANISGGTLVASGITGNTEFQIGAYGAGTWNQTGGSVIAETNWVSIGRQSGGVGVMTISGGSFTQSNPTRHIMVGEDGTGTLTLSGSAIVSNLGDQLILANGPAAFGTVNLNGGTLVVNQVVSGTGLSTFNFNGGTLAAGTAANASFLSGLTFAYVQSGGAIIDSGANNISIGQALLDGGGGGGLTKNGLGTLYLNAGNTYTGSTLVNAGALGGSGSIAGSVTVVSGAALAPGSGVGTLHIGGNLALGGSLLIDINKSLVQSNDLTVVGGTLTKTGAGTLTVANAGPALAAGDSFTLFNKPLAGGSLLSIGPAPGPGLSWTNRLAIDGSIAVIAGGVNTNPTNITAMVSGGNLNLSWPSDHTGWRLLVQTNHLTGLSTNSLDWGVVPGSDSTNAVSLPIDLAKPAEFYRLVYP